MKKQTIFFLLQIVLVFNIVAQNSSIHPDLPTISNSGNVILPVSISRDASFQNASSTSSVWVDPMELHERTFWANNNYPTVRNGSYGYSMYFFPDSNATVEVFGPAFINPWLSSVAQSFDLKGDMCALPNAPFDSTTNFFLKDVHYTIDSILIDYAYARFSPTNDIDTLIVAIYAKNNGNLTQYTQTIGGIDKSIFNYQNKANGKNLPDSAIAKYTVLLNASMAGGFFGRDLKIPVNLDIYDSEGEFAVALEFKPGRVHTKLTDTIARNANVFRVALAAPIGTLNYYPSLPNDKTNAGINDINQCKYGSLTRFSKCTNSLNCGYQIIGISALIAPQVSIVCDTIYDTVSIACSNQSFYTWRGQQLFTSGNYQYLAKSNTGCDTLNFLALTFSNVTFDTLIIQTCNEYIIPSGDTIINSGIFNDTIQNSLGCDSIIYIDLTIVGSFYSVFQNLIVCDSVFITRLGNINSSGNYYDTVLNTFSCDTVFEYLVIVNSTKFDTVQFHVCDSFITPSGNIKYANQIFNDTLKTVSNCDSIITINLTVSFSSSFLIIDTVCFSYTSTTGKLIDSTGVYYDTLNNSQGCDSIITYDLVVYHINDSVNAYNVSIWAVERQGKFQWLDCDNGYSPMLNDTTPAIFPSVKGTYAVEITQNGCVDTSNCEYVRKCSLNSLGNDYKSDGSTNVYLKTFDTTQILYIDWVISGLANIRTYNTDSLNYFFDDRIYLIRADVTYVDSSVCSRNFFQSINHTNECKVGIDTLGFDASGKLIVKLYLIKQSPFDEMLNWELSDSLSGLAGPTSVYYPNQDTIIDTLIYNTTTIRYWSRNTQSDRRCFKIIQVKGNVKIPCKAKFEIVQVAPFHLTVIDSSYGKGQVSKLWWYGDGQVDSLLGNAFPTHLYSSVGDFELCLHVIDYDTIRGFNSCYSVYCDSIKIDGSGIYSRSSASNSFTINIVPYSSYYNNDTVHETTCDTYISPSGKLFTQSGIYRDTLTSSYNSDSIIIIDLNIKLSTNSSTSISRCASYQLPGTGEIISSSGVYYDTILNSVGCDSIITLNIIIDTVTFGSINDTSCYSFISPTGKLFSVSGSYLDTLINGNGCDSILTLNLIINQDSYGTIFDSICDSYNSPSGKLYVLPGVYSDTISSLAGCDSIITINLINYIDTTLTVSGITISSAETGATFLWLDYGNNYASITGATNSTFTPSLNGVYVVELTKNSCVDTSEQVSINSVGIDENLLPIYTYSLFPNPNNGEFQISFNKEVSGLIIEIIDAQGKLVYSKSEETEQNFNFDINLSSGVYTLIMRNNNGKVNTQLIVQ